MIEERIGDIFEQDDINVIVHCANCFCTMGAGIAKIIKQRYPEAYRADCDFDFPKGSRKRLGQISLAEVENGTKIIVNVYGQYDYKSNYFKKRSFYLNYEALENGLKLIRSYLMNREGEWVLGIPHGIGCGLAGGNWVAVREIITKTFGDTSEIKVVICKLR